MSYASEVLADAPDAFWRLAETSGTTAADSSGNGHDGTYGGNFTLAQPSLLTVPAPGDYSVATTYSSPQSGGVTVPAATWMNPTDAMSVECLVKATQAGVVVLGRADTNFSFSSNYWSYFIAFQANGRLEVGVQPASGAMVYGSSANGAWTLNQIHHVALTVGAGTIRAYIDGVQTHTLTFGANLIANPGAIDLKLGRTYYQPSGLRGNIEGVALYKTTLTAARVAAHSAAAKSTTSTGTGVGQATEADTAQPVTTGLGARVVALGQANESDAAQIVVSGVAGTTAAVGQAVEDDIALTITPTGPEGPDEAVYDLTLSLDDHLVYETPCVLDARVGNGQDAEDVTFTLYQDALLIDDEILEEGVELNVDGTASVSLQIPALPAGTYTIRALGALSGLATDTLVVEVDALVDDPEPDLPPEIPDLDETQHWRFWDTTLGDPHGYEMPHNPSAWTSPWKPLWLEHQTTTAPDGAILAWQGSDRAWTWQFSGYLETQEAYEALQFWTELRRRFWLIDHRNQLHYVTFDNFDARARVVPNKPWAHDYTVSVVHFYRQTPGRAD